MVVQWEADSSTDNACVWQMTSSHPCQKKKSNLKLYACLPSLFYMFSSLQSTFWLKLLLLTEMYQHKRKSVVSWHTPSHVIIGFFTLCLLLLMFPAIAKTGVLRLDLTICMLKQLLESYSSKKTAKPWLLVFPETLTTTCEAIRWIVILPAVDLIYWIFDHRKFFPNLGL